MNLDILKMKAGNYDYQKERADLLERTIIALCLSLSGDVYYTDTSFSAALLYKLEFHRREMQRITLLTVERKNL